MHGQLERQPGYDPVHARRGLARGRGDHLDLVARLALDPDEVGDLHEASQAKLLRILQDGELQRVGGEQSVRVAVRVVSATNRRLDELIAAGKFREDLFYRLSVVPIRVPALREELDRRLAPLTRGGVHLLEGFAPIAKHAAQGAALLADGLAGGSSAPLVEALGIRDARGTLLDHLHVISPDAARARLGIAS